MLDIKENFALRRALMPEAWALSVPHISIDSLLQANSDFSALGMRVDSDEEALALLSANRSFNTLMFDALNYPIMAQWAILLENIAMRIYWIYVKAHGGLPFLPGQHDKLIEAFREDDVDRVRQLVSETLKQNEQRILESIFNNEHFYTYNLKI